MIDFGHAPLLAGADVCPCLLILAKADHQEEAGGAMPERQVQVATLATRGTPTGAQNKTQPGACDS